MSSRSPKSSSGSLAWVRSRPSRRARKSGRQVSSGAAGLALVVTTLAAGCRPAASSRPTSVADVLANYRLVDLTHSFDVETVYWPTAPSGFEQDVLSHGYTEEGYYYAANAFRAPEHGGTHMDAPLHFAEGQQDAASVPLERLVAPAIVLDISAAAASDPDYRITPEDVLTFEKAHGKIAPGSIVLLRTGWASRWPDRLSYLGDDTPGDAAHLHFPSFGPDAARLLVEERRVAALGADVASIDYGPSVDFLVHRIAMEAGVPGFENLANLEELPIEGALVIALPIKIAGGSGGPLRAVALVPR